MDDKSDPSILQGGSPDASADPPPAYEAATHAPVGHIAEKAGAAVQQSLPPQGLASSSGLVYTLSRSWPATSSTVSVGGQSVYFAQVHRLGHSLFSRTPEPDIVLHRGDSAGGPVVGSADLDRRGRDVEMRQGAAAAALTSASGLRGRRHRSMEIRNAHGVPLVLKWRRGRFERNFEIEDTADGHIVAEFHVGRLSGDRLELRQALDDGVVVWLLLAAAGVSIMERRGRSAVATGAAGASC